MSNALAAAREEVLPAEDKLQAVKEAVQQHRDLLLEKSDLEERLRDTNKRINDLVFQRLPDLFMQANITAVAIEAEGNSPPVRAQLKPYFKANIPDARAHEAFEWLERNGHGDLIKTEIKVLLGRGDRDVAIGVKKTLEEMGITFEEKASVPWNTLTAWMREQIEKHGIKVPLDLIGGTVGNHVVVKVG